MALKLMVFAPLGGQGKTFTSADVAIGLAEAGYQVFLGGCCFSNQLTLYFNGEEEDGNILNLEEQFLYEVPGLDTFVSGRQPLEELVLEVRPNLHFLPGGNVPEADHILRMEAGRRFGVPPVTILEDLFKEYEHNYDFMIFDMAPNNNTFLFSNLFYYVDTIVSPVEPQKRGLALIKLFARYLDVKHQDYRGQFGKPALRMSLIVPNRYLDNVNLQRRILAELKEEFSELTTNPIRSCASIGYAWDKGESFKEYTSQLDRALRKSEKESLETMAGIIETLAELRNEQVEA